MAVFVVLGPLLPVILKSSLVFSVTLSKMQLVLLIICISTVSICWSRPQGSAPVTVPAKVAQVLSQGTTPVPIISYTETLGENGAFNYSYETGNGIKFAEAGVLKHITGLRARGGFTDPNTPDEEDVLVQTGSFSYTAPDGQVISLKYTADENGFQPVGEHLPTPPPIPADIQRALDQLPKDNLQQQPTNAPVVL